MILTNAMNYFTTGPFTTQYLARARGTSLGAVLLGAVLLGAVTLLTSCGEESPSKSARQESEKAASATSAPLGSDEVKLTPESIATNGLRIETAAKTELQPTFRVPAHIAFNKEGMAHVGSPVKGRVSELSVFPAHWDPKLRIPRGQVVAAASIVSPKY